MIPRDDFSHLYVSLNCDTSETGQKLVGMCFMACWVQFVSISGHFNDSLVFFQDGLHVLGKFQTQENWEKHNPFRITDYVFLNSLVFGTIDINIKSGQFIISYFAKKLKKCYWTFFLYKNHVVSMNVPNVMVCNIAAISEELTPPLMSCGFDADQLVILGLSFSPENWWLLGIFQLMT